MRKLIEKEQDILINCDNPECDYTVPYEDTSKDDLSMFVNKPCPKCGENLLTIDDYLQHQTLMKVVNFINRWFSWITIFYSKKTWAKRQSVSVYVHDGVKINKQN